MITKVWNDRLVNLTVFPDNGTTRGWVSIQLRQPGDVADTDIWCEWTGRQVMESGGFGASGRLTSEAKASVSLDKGDGETQVC